MSMSSIVPLSRTNPATIVGQTYFSHAYGLIFPTYNNGTYGTFPGNFTHLIKGFDATLGTLKAVHLDLTVDGYVEDIIQNPGNYTADVYLGPWSGNPNIPQTVHQLYIGDATEQYLLQSAVTTLANTHVQVPPKQDGWLKVTNSATTTDTVGLTDPAWLAYFSQQHVGLKFLVQTNAHVEIANTVGSGLVDTHFTGGLLHIRYEYQ